MKKTMILTTVLFVSTFFMSCNSDDDDGVQDTIIGKWQLEKQFKNDIEKSLSDCEKKSTMEFKTDNTFVDMGSSFDQNQHCTSSTDPGTWKYNGDNAIKVSYDGDAKIMNVTFSFVKGNLNLVYKDAKSIYKKIN